LTQKPFWEESYKRPGRLDTFGGGKPSQEVVTLTSRMQTGLRALDLGCGEGRNALYLAGLGFITSASDISVSGIEKLDFVAAEMNLHLDSSVCEILIVESRLIEFWRLALNLYVVRSKHKPNIYSIIQLIFRYHMVSEMFVKRYVHRIRSI